MRRLRHYFLLIIAMSHFACAEALTTTQELTVEMFGVFKVPEGAEGNASPKFYEITFVSILLGGDEELEYAPEATSALRIIDRPQVVFREDVEKYDGTSFTSATVTLESAVVAGGKYSNYDLTLTDPIITKTEDFGIKTGKGVHVIIKVEWQNTIDRDRDAETEAVVEPTFELEVEES